MFIIANLSFGKSVKEQETNLFSLSINLNSYVFRKKNSTPRIKYKLLLDFYEVIKSKYRDKKIIENIADL